MCGIALANKPMIYICFGNIKPCIKRLWSATTRWAAMYYMAIQDLVQKNSWLLIPLSTSPYPYFSFKYFSSLIFQELKLSSDYLFLLRAQSIFDLVSHRVWKRNEMCLSWFKPTEHIGYIDTIENSEKCHCKQ